MNKAGIAVLLGLVGVVWYGRKAKSAVILPGMGEGDATEQAAAMIAAPVESSQALEGYIAAYPTSAGLIGQVQDHLIRGTASVEDMVVFGAEMRAFDAYVKDGGTLNMEDFLIEKRSSMAPQYEAIIEEAKATNVKAKVLELESEGTKVVEYSLRTLGTTNPVWQELAARHPESVPADKQGIPTPFVHLAAPVIEPEPETKPFTATSGQLQNLEELLGGQGDAYQDALNTAYEAAQEESGNGVVSWSSEGGYEPSSSKDIAEKAAASGADAWTYYT